jgi:hypothetical protein
VRQPVVRERVLQGDVGLVCTSGLALEVGSRYLPLLYRVVHSCKRCCKVSFERRQAGTASKAAQQIMLGCGVARLVISVYEGSTFKLLVKLVSTRLCLASHAARFA